MKCRSLGSILLFSLLLPWSGIRAQEAPRPDEPVQAQPEGDAAIARLKSPFCPGLMLEVCTHPDSKILRDTIQLMAKAGASADSLVAWMLANYGDEYLAVPRIRGKGLWAWIMPPLGLLVGLLVVVVALKRFRTRQMTEEVPASPLTEEDESVLAEALEELRAEEEVPF